jgi:hypothetical protein
MVPVALVAVACSGSGGGKASPATTSATTSVPVTTTVTAPPTSAASTVPATAVGRCTTADLSLRANGGNGAAGHAIANFELVNTSTKACRMLGYPGVALLDASGATLTNAGRTPGMILGDLPPATVTVAAGQRAYFGVESVNVCTGDVRPTTSATIRVTPPDETASFSAPATITVCPGQQSVLVSPVRGNPADVTRH